MLSSLNAFGGLSATELLTLFGANSSSASSASASKAQSVSTGVSGSSANDPAKTIQAILAQAQIAQAQTAISGAQSASSATADAAYAAQTPAKSPTDISTYTAYAAQTPEGSATGMTWEQAGQVAGIGYLMSESATSVSSASGSVDTFQFAISFGNVSVDVQLAVDGLGQVKPAPGVLGVDVGQGNLTDGFQIMASKDGSGVSFAFGVNGLDTAQALQLGAAFKEATSALNNAGSVSSSSWTYQPSA